MIRADALRGFADLVAVLGGDAGALLARARIDAGVFARRHAVIPLRSHARLLDLAAAELAVPDFALRLAAAQDPAKALGPLAVAMANARTLGDALAYGAGHAQAFASAIRLDLRGGAEGGAVLRLVARQLIAGQPGGERAVEHLLLLARFIAAIAGRDDVVAQVRQMRDIPPDAAAHARHFGVPVAFGQEHDALVLTAGAGAVPLPAADPLLYELAITYIGQHYPPDEVDLPVRVAAIIEQLLQAGSFSPEDAAAMLGMHPRSLQRRLKAAGESFEAIRDRVRRDLALRHLEQTDLPLIRLAELLGYSDASVLTRSCHRWFNRSPRQIRAGRAG